MKPCDSLAGKLLGHNFQGRYSVEERKHPSPEFGMFMTSNRPIPQNLYRKTYHGDVCTRCGETINKPEDA